MEVCPRLARLPLEHRPAHSQRSLAVLRRKKPPVLGEDPVPAEVVAELSELLGGPGAFEFHFTSSLSESENDRRRQLAYFEVELGDP